MIYRTLLFITILVTNFELHSQVSIKQSEVDYSLTIKQDSVYRILTFWKHKDSTVYSSVKYSISDFNKTSSEKILTDEIDVINQLWHIAEDSIKFNLESFNISYPLFYSDVLKNHIQAFIESEEWQNHIKLNGKKLDYDIIKEVMLDKDVYEPLNNFLKLKAYTITGFETEKHGFVTNKNLQKVGYTGNEIVPMPFIIWAILKKSN